MRVVLGIDAAWTPAQPSGVALATEEPSGWQLVAAAASYHNFLALADRSLTAQTRPAGSYPDAAALLAAASSLCGAAISLVAIDMPLARSPIVGRRVSDDAVSRAYGRRRCGTHTPSASRPGAMSEALNEGFTRAGYPLQTISLRTPGLIEVYPHPALVELMGAAERLPYKVSKIRKYWLAHTTAERRLRLNQQWNEIITSLDREIAGVAIGLPTPGLEAKAGELKAFEDTLDSVVCAWVGICALEGRAKPFGDADSAIWIPLPRFA